MYKQRRSIFTNNVKTKWTNVTGYKLMLSPNMVKLQDGVTTSLLALSSHNNEGYFNDNLLYSCINTVILFNDVVICSIFTTGMRKDQKQMLIKVKPNL